MTYRQAQPEEMATLEPVFRKFGGTLPNPSTSTIVLAINEKNELAGFLVIQLQLHLEPLLLFDPLAYRGLVKKAESMLMERFATCTYFTSCPDEHTINMATVMGMHPVPGNLMMKELINTKSNGDGITLV